jgi:hypothetical protein
MPRVKTLPFILATASVFGLAQSQVTSKSRPEGTSNRVAVYKHAANQIAKADPNVSPETLQYDLPVVENAEQKLRAFYPASFSDSQVRHINTLAWMDYRDDHPNGKLDLDTFAKFAYESYGGLEVTSTPSGASIVVDSKPWGDLTDVKSSCRTGKRHITLSKQGYEDAEGDTVVTEGQWTIFHKDLNKK